MQRIYAILALGFLALRVCLSVGQASSGQRYALLVGVDEYDQANFIHALGAAGADAEDLGKALIEVGGFPKDNVRVLTSHSGNKPTSANILYELDQLAKRVKTGDTVFFFFSGHGIELGGSTFLLPADTDPRSELMLRRTAVATSEVQGGLSKLSANNLILAFDMCRTDPLKSDRDADPRSDLVSAKQVKDLVLVPDSAGGTGPKQVVTFFSCSPGQKSYEWRSEKRGYFSYYFEQALRGQAADPKTGEIRVGDLQTFVVKSVTTAVKQNENSDQVPFIKQEGPDPGRMALAWAKPSTPTEAGGSVRETSTIAKMRVTVSDTQGHPIPNPTITLDGKVVGSEPSLNLEDQKTRDVELVVKADGFLAKVLQVSLERGRETPIDVKLDPKPSEPAPSNPPAGRTGTGRAKFGLSAEFIASGVSKQRGGYIPVRANFGEQNPPRLIKQPDGMANPQYGAIVLADRKIWFAVDENDASKIAIDVNGDGDFTNDPAPAWSRNATTKIFMGTFLGDVGMGLPASIGVYRFDPDDAARQQLRHAILYYADYGFTLHLVLDGNPYEAVLIGDLKDAKTIGVDRNGDGTISLLSETLKVGTPFNFTGTTYVIERSGDQLTIKPSASPVPLLPPPANLKQGAIAPTFVAKTTTGQSISFPDTYRGKVVMLFFWASWAGPCQTEAPYVADAYRRYRSQGFDVLGISFDQANASAAMVAFEAKYNMTWAEIYEGKYWDTTIGRQFDVSAIPFNLLVDGDSGKILASGTDFRGSEIDAIVAKAIAKKRGGER